MPKRKVNELTGLALDWAVAKGRGFLEPEENQYVSGPPVPRVALCNGTWCDRWVVRWNPLPDVYYSPDFNPSEKWEIAGPLVDELDMELTSDLGGPGAPSEYLANLSSPLLRPDGSAKWYAVACGPTRLIAICRCYVRAKLGDEIEIPEELA